MGHNKQQKFEHEVPKRYPFERGKRKGKSIDRNNIFIINKTKKNGTNRKIIKRNI